MKCRLCLCFVDKQVGYSSLLDNGFNHMVKQVLCFAMATDHATEDKQYALPVMVCKQCSKTVRNFYAYSKMVETNQKRLRSESSQQNASMSIDELLQAVEQKDDLEHNEKNGNFEESLFMSADVESSESDSDSDQNVRASTEASRSTCLDKVEVIDSIARVEERLSVVTASLDRALRRLPILSTLKPDAHLPSFNANPITADAEIISLNNPATDARLLSFDFNPITVVAELDSLNNKLTNNEYFKLILRWVDSQTLPTVGGEHCMHNAIDLIFSKPFFSSCSWTGVSREGKEKRKVALKNYKEVLKLFKFIGAARGQNVTNIMVETFFRRKLKHAKCRLNLQGFRSVCRPPRR